MSPFLAAFLPTRPEHKVIDEELAFAAEQIGERDFARRPVENVFLFDFDPRQLATLEVQFVALLRKLLLPREKFLAGSQSFFLRNDLAVLDSAYGFDFRYRVLLCFIEDTFQTLATRGSSRPTAARLTSTHPFAV
jgi:hypothetical protein